MTVKDNPPAIGGYTFSGWNVQSPDGVEISNGKFTMPASNVVICGEYTRNSYTVSYKAYNVNGSEISLDPSVYGTKNYNSGDEVTLAPVLTHDEYTFDGWKADITKCTSYKKLPKAAREYVEFIEDFTGTKVGIVSVGADRNQTFVREKIWK